MRLKFGFDIDGVVADLNTLLTKVSAEYLGQHLIPEDTKFYLLRHCYGGISLDMEKKIVDEVLTKERTKELEPERGAIETLKKWYRRYGKLTFITSREDPDVLQPFIEKYFTDQFEYEIYYEGLKGHLCNQLNITHFVDDYIFNAVDLANHGVFPIIYDQPYNRNCVSSRLMGRLCSRVFGWEDFDFKYLQSALTFVYYKHE